jgi:hypothetical protein
VDQGDPPAQQDPHRRAGTGQRDEDGAASAGREHHLGDHADVDGELACPRAQDVVEQLQVAGAGGVLDGQHLGVVPAALDRALPGGDVELEVDVRDVVSRKETSAGS